MEGKWMQAVIDDIKNGYVDLLEDLIDKACVGCALIALADAVGRMDKPKEREELREFARRFSGREDYCGECKADLWDIPRKEAGGLARPWDTHGKRE